MKRIIALCALCACLPASAQNLTVGSKRFTESFILGEILAQSVGATHKPGLGNTAILLEALKSGSIDLYPEYTGTIAREILKSEERLGLAALNQRLQPLGLAAGIPLGFSNSYALGMRRKDAERLGVRKVSDLAKHAALRFGLSHEFLGRRDGWPGLQAAYRLPQKPRGLDHGIAYEALAAGEIDVMDLYTTDAKIERFGIVALDDDRAFFPAYDAVLLYRADVPKRFAREIESLKMLEGRIDAQAMIRLNARAELDKMPFADVAREFLGARAQSRAGFEAVERRHHHVEQDDAGPQPFECRQAGLAVLGFFDGEVALLERLAREGARDGVVVDEQDKLPGGRSTHDCESVREAAACILAIVRGSATRTSANSFSTRLSHCPASAIRPARARDSISRQCCASRNAPSVVPPCATT